MCCCIFCIRRRSKQRRIRIQQHRRDLHVRYSEVRQSVEMQDSNSPSSDDLGIPENPAIGLRRRIAIRDRPNSDLRIEEVDESDVVPTDNELSNAIAGPSKSRRPSLAAPITLNTVSLLTLFYEAKTAAALTRLLAVSATIHANISHDGQTFNDAHASKLTQDFINGKSQSLRFDIFFRNCKFKCDLPHLVFLPTSPSSLYVCYCHHPAISRTLLHGANTYQDHRPVRQNLQRATSASPSYTAQRGSLPAGELLQT